MFVPDFVHLQSMSSRTGLGTGMTHESSRRYVLSFNMGFCSLSGDGGVVKTGETAPTTIRLSLQLSLDCSVNFSQAPSNKNYKEEQIFILDKGYSRSGDIDNGECSGSFWLDSACDMQGK